MRPNSFFFLLFLLFFSRFYFFCSFSPFSDLPFLVRKGNGGCDVGRGRVGPVVRTNESILILAWEDVLGKKKKCPFSQEGINYASLSRHRLIDYLKS